MWRSLFGFEGATLLGVVLVFDVTPFLLQSAFVSYLYYQLLTLPVDQTCGSEDAVGLMMDKGEMSCATQSNKNASSGCCSSPQVAVPCERLEKQDLVSV